MRHGAALPRIPWAREGSAEEDINKFLSTHEIRVLHMAQSESGDFISVTLIFDEAELQVREALLAIPGIEDD